MASRSSIEAHQEVPAYHRPERGIQTATGPLGTMPRCLAWQHRLLGVEAQASIEGLITALIVPCENRMHH